jgi:hypothetical protein
MNTKEKLRLFGLIIILTGFSLAWIFFSWKLVVVLIILLTGNNLEQRLND